jgi:hypothetical protein
MASTTATVRLTVDTRLATAWVRACKAVAYVIPSERLFRLAGWGAERLIRFRMDDGPWRWGVQ